MSGCNGKVSRNLRVVKGRPSRGKREPRFLPRAFKRAMILEAYLRESITRDEAYQMLADVDRKAS